MKGVDKPEWEQTKRVHAVAMRAWTKETGTNQMKIGVSNDGGHNPDRSE